MLLLACAALADDLDPALGRALFKRNWVPAPSSTDAANGLGPLFNARSCEGCHLGGGAARVVSGSNGRTTLKGAAVRLGNGAGTPDPYYGLQLQTDAVPGLAAEARVRFLPKLDIELLGPELAADIKTSVRLAPALAGRARFDAIPDEEILKRADPGDSDGNGIKGRARRLGSDGVSGPVGRFGWKAAHATLDSQIANAFALDLGLSSPLDMRPYGDCTEAETDCRAAPNGVSPKQGGYEIGSEITRLVAAYVSSLEPPDASEDAEGREVFDKTGCAACHVPNLMDRNNQPIATYSDLLLHDMGPALDDGAGEAGAASAEWRTAPLLGLPARDGNRRYLHDGRAATLEAAILAHGGEASAARDIFEKLDLADKRRLIAFLKQL